MIQVINLLSKYALDITHVEIEKLYGEKHRYYHTLEHITFLINKINKIYEWDENEKERDILILAALFHDIIYDTQKSDNEEQSVSFFKSKIHNKMTPELQKVCDIILATKNHKITGDKLTDIFCDLDMWILSNGSFVEILDNERKIFKEYQFVYIKQNK